MLTNKKERSRSHALKNARLLSRQASSNATNITHVKIKPAFLPGVKYMRFCRKYSTCLAIGYYTTNFQNFQ